ncbi:MAG: von Willebrand factor type A domain-containing protein [Candidatus Pseudobacter hemicellulosilyticus]|uniref:von Willebrand factor type A domain-containing protein n=1 Tax=Candidatus Pseudobacter hemicellulosilyticus TaxID=3121375 RepID=A0AAJ5WVB1_9BACT|nr:MAG: von Willebrand factor type A domain-containing protein [Pseudobacter sp.]
MRLAVAIFIYLTCSFSAKAQQYYLRGEIVDEKRNPLQNVKLKLHATGFPYSSGVNGSFGILSTKIGDSITITLDGYQAQTVFVESGRYLSIVLKMLHASANLQKNRLVSLTRDLQPDDRRKMAAGGETYSSLMENEFIPAKKYPETGFAIHTDKAAYSNIRRFLNMNTTVPPDAVRTEELLNYFNFDYSPPAAADSIFGFRSYLSDCPWNPNNRLLYLNVCARRIDTANIPPSNLVFLVDISGSMDMPNRLPLLKSSFKLLVDNLRPADTVSIVVYGSTVGLWLPPTSGGEKDKIRRSIEELYPGGATPGESGILTAYRVAKSQFIKGGNNRVILATDGDFNVGQSGEQELEKLITQHQESGIYLTCLGVGMGNYKDSKLEVLAKKGNGNFAYLDSESEGEKVLVKELTQTLFTVADDAFLNIRFNEDLVKEYRLIGFDNKLKALADSLKEVEGGEVGPGHSLLVLFELTPGGALNAVPDELAEVTIHYRRPGDSLHRSSEYTVPAAFTAFKQLPSCYRFASSVVMFASLLKYSPYVKSNAWNEAILVASDACNPNDAIQKEYIGMISKAKKIYAKMGRKRHKAREQ